MVYYVKKQDDDIIILGSIDNQTLIPSECIECTEEEYQSYYEQLQIKQFGTIEQREYDVILEDIRTYREYFFSAFDIYKTNLYYGLIEETPSEKEEIIIWYQQWLDLPNTITIENYKNVVYPNTPIKISRYLKG